MLRALAATLRGHTPFVPSLPHTQAAAATDDPALCITGERVLLRPLVPGDAEAMFAMASDPVVIRYLPWRPSPSMDAVVRPYLEEQVEMRQRGRGIGLAVVLRATGEMIGSTQLMDLKAVPGRAELGYLLAPAYWGQGLMSEAAHLTLNYGFHTLQLARVIAFADAENTASRRVLEKIGMRPWGTEIRSVKGEERLYVRYNIYRGTT